MKQTHLKKLLLGAFAFAGLVSCSQDLPLVENKSEKEPVNNTNTTKVQLSSIQALAYASMFSTPADNAGKPEELRSLKPREVSHLSYYVEQQDTLLYAVNYKNNEGFIILSGDNSSFPIIAHSDTGNLNFADIPTGSPLHSELAGHIAKAKSNLHNPNRVNTEYFNKWKDLGNKDYQYEIVPNSPTPASELRGYRDYSTGKESIYPSTGKDLNKWEQAGTFNEFAPNKAAIGCPAVSIGMLLYDCANRIGGNYTHTYPSVLFSAKEADSQNHYGREVSSVLKEIADSIPNYKWGQREGVLSGAAPEDIVLGLKKIGFKNAQLVNYNFETLYSNLSFKAKNYFGEEATYYRGVLIGGLHPYEPSGHIWFCDGYYEQAYRVTKKFLFIKIKSWTEYDDRLYMNWGWGPEGGNGWYRATDEHWTSPNHSTKYFKYEPKMIIGLHEYDRP